MAETKARFLADQISTTDANQSFTLPSTRGTNNYVMTRDDSVGTGGTAWKETLVSPTITALKYSNQTSGTFVENSGQTATDPAGGDLCQLTGLYFDSTLASPADPSNLAISIDGTSATSISVNSAGTEATFTAPAKSAGSYTLTATNASGLNATTTISYDANPTWVTASAPSSSLGVFIDGSITGTNGPQIIASEDGSNLTTGYKQVTSNSDNTVITSGIAGLTVGDNGYLTGTLAGTNGGTNTFYAVAHDNENQQSAIRQFHFISYDYAGSGGDDVWSYQHGGSGTTYRIHIFRTTGSTHTFTANTAITGADILIVGGGGSGGNGLGGGGAGAVVQLASSYTITSGSHDIVVGAGAGVNSSNNGNGSSGSASTFDASNNGSNIIKALGGGGGAGEGKTASGPNGNPATDFSNTGGTSYNNSPAGGPNGVPGPTYTNWTAYHGKKGGGGSVAPNYTSGGGAGANGNGGTGTTSNGGNGGVGIQIAWATPRALKQATGTTNGTPLDTGFHWAGGGGGSVHVSSKTSGSGQHGGGGGAAHSGSYVGSQGDAEAYNAGNAGNNGNNSAGGNAGGNTGGGGGGGTDGSGNGGSGGSGIVVIRYAI